MRESNASWILFKMLETSEFYNTQKIKLAFVLGEGESLDLLLQFLRRDC